MKYLTRLNLGCGSCYKPDYINVDKYDSSVADLLCDIDHLPFGSNCVDLIESSQVVEHFDYVHCKYVLSEWFRVLRPGGNLVLETPDLKKTFKKFLSADVMTKQTTLQWFFGIDSPGMRHGTGFSADLLTHLLNEVGFADISREKPLTHRYEHGIRMTCAKPQDFSHPQLLACFRQRLRRRLKTDDSYVLIPLEKWLDKMRPYTTLPGEKDTCIDQIIVKTAMCHPGIPLAFVEESVASGLVAESQVKDRIELLNQLMEMDFHKKVFSLWMKSKKAPNELGRECEGFLQRQESLVCDLLSSPEEPAAGLNYVMGLEPTDIAIFDFSLASLEACRILNTGLRYFHKGELHRAMESFSMSCQMNPADPWAYWNMARLGCILKMEDHDVIDNYELALALMKDREHRRSIQTELGHTREGRRHMVPREPVWEVGPPA